MKKFLVGCGVFFVIVMLCGVMTLGGLMVIGMLVDETETPAPFPTSAVVIPTLTPASVAQQPTAAPLPTYTPQPNYTPAVPPLDAKIPYRAVVQILAEARHNGVLEPVWSGSGTIVDPRGFILTNAHVALSDAEERVAALQILLTEAEDKPPVPRYYAEVVVADEALDIAVLRITTDLDGNPVNPESLNLPYVRLGDSDKLHLGQPLVILGYPGIGGNTITLTRGEVSGFTAEAGYGDRAFIKTSATIAGGNSGGMVADAHGNLVAIPTMLGSGDTGGDVVDCRYLADTNGDGYIDEDDTCVPTGGFINALRPINLAKPLLAAALGGAQYTPPQSSAGQPSGFPSGSAVIFSDDFSNAGGGWPVEHSDTAIAEITADGWYRLMVKKSQWIVWADPGVKAADAIIEVDARQVSGGDQAGDYGIFCRETPRGEMYYFAVGSDGYFQIVLLDNEGNATPLSGDWKFSDAINQGDAENHIRVACVGDTLQLEVNGEVLSTVHDGTLTRGLVGLMASTYDEGGLDVRFDNFVVARP